MTKFLNISTDNTLGGSSASDEIVSSQKAIKGYVDGYALHNAASYPEDGLKVLGGGTVSGHYSTILGVGANDGGYKGVTAIGYNSGRSSSYIQNATAIGSNAKVSGDGAIQIGAGTNSESCSLSIGFTDYNDTVVGNYKLLGSTGLIPIERLGGNSSSTDSKFLKEDGSWATVSGGGWTPPSQTGNAGKFLTTDGSDTNWGVPKSFNLFDSKWSDYILNDQSWLRADTFSWQDGTVYSDAYNHLVADYQGGTSQTETVGSYTITYVLATDGHKITTDGTTVANIYNECGVAWYYILDTTNQRFKLPRTKWGFVGLRDTVGKYAPESLPNISGTTKIVNDQGIYRADPQGAFYTGDSIGSGIPTRYGSLEGFRLGFNASRSSSTYQDNAPVQQRATQMYLYFYVGQFSQSATEQTAGLNTELFNVKADIDAGNFSSSGKETIVGFSAIDYDSKTNVSSSPYTATKDGLFVLQSDGSDDMTISVNGNVIQHVYYSQIQDLLFSVPVGKGDVVTYVARGRGTQAAFFYPVKGE